jgi:hypothetical protein
MTHARLIRSLLPIAATLGWLCAAGITAADVVSDRAAAILVYPLIVHDSTQCTDTLIEISNTSTELVTAHCFYVNANSHCSNTGLPCSSGAQCAGGLCLPDWNETDFLIRLTARQPLAWLASEGLQNYCGASPTSGEPCIPLDGIKRRGPTGQTNTGTRIPPVSDDPFVGELKCIAVDEQRRPVERNVLVGSTTIETACEGECLDVTRHNAIGIQAIEGTNNQDNRLVLGQEYNPCPNTLIMNHFFDFATDPASGDTVFNVLVLVPCSEDFLLQNNNLAKITAQFLVFNEFEQRFSTSTHVQCFASLPISNIDTGQATRSIFTVGIAGTLTGQTRITGVGSGGHALLGVHFDGHGAHSSAANLHFQGISSTPDVIVLP